MNDLGIINPCCGMTNMSRVVRTLNGKDKIIRYRTCTNPSCKGGKDRNPGNFVTEEKIVRMCN